MTFGTRRLENMCAPTCLPPQPPSPPLLCFGTTDENCRDRRHNCVMVVQARLCVYSYYKTACCASCTHSAALRAKRHWQANCRQAAPPVCKKFKIGPQLPDHNPSPPSTPPWTTRTRSVTCGGMLSMTFHGLAFSSRKKKKKILWKRPLLSAQAC